MKRLEQFSLSFTLPASILVLVSCWTNPKWEPDIKDLSPYIVTLKTDAGEESNGLALQVIPDAVWKIKRQQIVVIGPQQFIKDNPKAITVVFQQYPNKPSIETNLIIETLESITAHTTGSMASVGEPNEVFVAEIEPLDELDVLIGNDFLLKTKLSLSAQDQLFDALEFNDDTPKSEYPTGFPLHIYFELYFNRRK